MRDRQRKAQQRATARQRAILASAGMVSLPTKRKAQRVPATAEQLAFRDYIAMGMTASDARARIMSDRAA